MPKRKLSETNQIVYDFYGLEVDDQPREHCVV